MIWIIGLGLACYGVYFLFFRKKKRVVTRVKTLTYDDYFPERVEEEKDKRDSFDFYSAIVLPAQGRYRIDYKDRNGEETTREIEVRQVQESHGRYAIDAYCYLRYDHRTFINDRVQEAVNLDSEEVVEDLACDAMAQYKASPEGCALTAIDMEWKAVAILVYVCRADGRMRKPERTIIAGFLKRRCTDLTLDDKELDSAIKSIRGIPEYREFKRFIRDLKVDGDHDKLNDLLECAKRIVASEKTIDPMEKAALEVLEKAIS